MKLIPEARLAWRFGSVQGALVLAFLSAVQAEVLPLVAPLFAPEVWPWVSGVLALAIVVLRLAAQPALEPERQQLQMAQAAVQTTPAFDVRGQDVDGVIEGMAEALYSASGLTKPWAYVSPEFRERWRTVAAAALAHSRPVAQSGLELNNAAPNTEEHF